MVIKQQVYPKVTADFLLFRSGREYIHQVYVTILFYSGAMMQAIE
ncbi:MAG TPA: hypothetical protein VKA70_03095 [Blastocatellia bacterium]|nr:hypothetical protein [Blastocatellia bacterium]